MAKRALCIGINDYPGTDSDLSGCVNDAEDWADLLVQRGFTVRKLLDRQATGAAICRGIARLLADSEPGDRLVIQFSGHGTFVPDEDGDESDGTDECLCPYDVMARGPISDDDLFEYYSCRPPRTRLVMIADSCHSGTVARFAPITTPATLPQANAPQRNVRFLPPATFLSRRSLARLGTRYRARRGNPPGRHAGLVIAGCQDHEYSYDAVFEGRSNGVFTFVALRALAALGPESTYQDWIQAIRQVLPSRQYPQSPKLHGHTHWKKWRLFH